MNGKFEERLARLAFGDLTPEEANRLEREAQGNPEATRILNEYHAMRAGLRSLGADVPPDQLSKERLRDAILGQGLRPVPEAAAPSNRGWMWMPVLAGAAAFAIFTMRGKGPSGEPTIVLDDAKGPSTVATQMATPSHPFSVDPVFTKRTQAAPVKAAAKTVSNPVKRTEVPEVRIRTHHPIVLEDRWVEWVPEGEESSTKMVAKNDPETTPPATPAHDSAEPSSEEIVASSNAPIVLIGSSKDAETGTNTATEVGTTRNVLVGG